MNFPLIRLLNRRSQSQRFGRGHISYAFAVLATAHLILGVAYLTWRTDGGMSEDARLLSWIFLLAEGFTLVGAMGFSLSHLRYRFPPCDRFPGLQSAMAELPLIDVVIIRQGESITATCQTAQLVQGLDYPESCLSIRIVDCDTDLGLARQISDLSYEYTATEAKRSRALQDLLKQDVLEGDYVLVLDVGQFPNRDLLQRLLPYFFDTPETAPIANRTGYVQPMLTALERQRAEHPLQQFIPLGEVGGDCAPLLGSGALFRQQALADLPQIDWDYPVRLGTELHIRGWRSHICRSTSISGISIPLRNRQMALLAVQHAVRLLPWWRIPITQTQRFQYVWLALWSIGGIATTLYLFVPVWFLWTGIAPVPAFDFVFMTWFLPYVTLGRLAWLASTPSNCWKATWRAERQTGAQFFQSIQTTLSSAMGKRPIAKAPSRWSFGPQAVAIVLTVSAIIVGIIRLFAIEDGSVLVGLAFCLAWATYNVALLSVVPPDLAARHQAKDPIAN
ncbi:MAG: cellulose synthase [Cyanobacteria bacterium P01_E01_bin.34]